MQHACKKGQLRVEIAFILALFHLLKPLTDEKRGGNQNAQRKPLTTSFTKCHILKQKNSSPNQDSNPHSNIGGRLLQEKQTCEPLYHSLPWHCPWIHFWVLARQLRAIYLVIKVLKPQYCLLGGKLTPKCACGLLLLPFCPHLSVFRELMGICRCRLKAIRLRTEGGWLIIHRIKTVCDPSFKELITRPPHRW